MGSVFVSECCFFLCYGCASMLVSVTFNVGMRGNWVHWLCSAEKEISQEEGDSRLSPSSTMLLGLVLFGYLFCVFFWRALRNCDMLSTRTVQWKLVFVD